MGFVESVAGETGDFVEDFVGDVWRNLIGFCAAFDEGFTLFVHD